MSYRNERFNQSMRSLDMVASGRDISKWPVLSDLGRDVRRMLDALDGVCEADTREEKLFEAEMRLVDAGLKHLIPVLLLIVENGPYREYSLARVPPRTYFRHRAELLAFFDYHTQVNA